MPQKEKAHQHGEAFMLMQYSCMDCGHAEIFWNARDGVTPFGCPCPNCDQGNMLHVRWGEDRYAPDHCPHPGQGVFINVPPELVPVMVRMAAKTYQEAKGEEPPAEFLEAITAHYSQPGAPWFLRWPEWGG